MGIFSMDGAFYRIGSDIADWMILAFYWILGCIPIVTIGASTTAVFYVCGKKARGEDCYITKDFIKSFKENFKQSLPITVFFLVGWFSASMYFYLLFLQSSELPVFILSIAMFALVEILLFTLYVFSLLSRFHMKTSTIFVTAFVLIHKHLLTSLMLLVATIALGFLGLSIPVLLLFVPVMVIQVSAYPIQKIFKKQLGVNEELITEEASVETEEIVITEEITEQVEEDKEYLKYI